MLFYNNLCLSSVSNATLVIFVLNCFYSIINNTYPLSVKLVSKQFNGFCHSPQDFHLCIINVAVPIACDALNAQTVAVREYHYQTEQFMAIKEDKSFTRTQIGYRSLLLEKGHGVSVSTARCLSKVLNCFIQLSKNTKEENRLSYISRWKRAKA